MKYHKPLPVKTTYIGSIGIPTSARASAAGAPMPTHGVGSAGSGGGSANSGGGGGGGGGGPVTIDWTAERPNVEVCASNVYNC